MERGSGTGAAGTVVIPAPRCWVRLLEGTRRRVGRVEPVRAEPIGVLDSRIDTPVRVATVLVVVVDGVLGDSAAA